MMRSFLPEASTANMRVSRGGFIPRSRENAFRIGIFSKKTANHFHLGPGCDIKVNGDVYNETTVPFLSRNIFGGIGNG
jgi:hypothetical protein